MNEGDAALRDLDPRRWIPALRWLPAYDRSWLRSDLIAFDASGNPRQLCTGKRTH